MKYDTESSAATVVKSFVSGKPDFQVLWNLMVSETTRVGDVRTRAAFVNHEMRKEYVCRRYGIVSANDVIRMVSKLEKRSGMRRRYR